jgi:transcriptional regulator with XRE-family HTH domain
MLPEADRVNRLREIREVRKMTQAELGRRVRVDPSLIRHVEAGRMQAYPRLRRLVSRVLGVAAEDIFPDTR